jgi:peptidyl-prolyl cis-trans isomerase C
MGCSVKNALTQNLRKAVSVNGVPIPHDEISREAQNHPSPTPIAAWTAAARALAVRELLLQEARRSGFEAEPLSDGEGRTETDDEASIRILVEREVPVPTPDEAACRRYYEQNLRRFRSADVYEAAHILIAAPPHDRSAYAVARDQAATLVAAVRAAPERFAELALAHSACPSKAVAGNLGQLSTGDTTPEFDKALRAMTPWETSAEPVASRFGYHIIRLDRKIEARQVPFEHVRDRIADYLIDRTRHTAIAQFVARVAARADVRGIDLPTPADLRVS